MINQRNIIKYHGLALSLSVRESFKHLVIKDLELEEASKLVMEHPSILPHFHKRSIIVYPQVLSNRRRKRFLIATDLGSKKINIIPIVLELYYVREPYRDIDLTTMPLQAAERVIYNDILEDLEMIELCRSRAKWVKEIEKWLSIVYKDKKRENICERLFIDEATLLLQFIDQRIRETIDELNRKLDFVIYVSEIKRAEIDENTTIYLSTSYSSWYSDERKEDLFQIIDRNPFVL